jgi:uncharacterized protein
MSVATQCASQIVPNFFGTARRSLFGIYHAPASEAARDAGVVLCHPAPQDYSQTFWAIRKLAGMLADAGFHVLRFDYSCTGDSAGDSIDATLAQWTDDIGTAVTELQDIAGVRRISLVGMRLGAVLAMRATATGVRARDLVLWDPIITGTAYLAELDALEDRRLRLLNFPEPDDRVHDELMGYPFTAAMRRDVAAIDTARQPIGRVDRLCIATARGDDTTVPLAVRAESVQLVTTVVHVADPVLYAGSGHPSDSLLAHNVPVAITAFLAGRGA